MRIIRNDDYPLLSPPLPSSFNALSGKIWDRKYLPKIMEISLQALIERIELLDYSVSSKWLYSERFKDIGIFIDTLRDILTNINWNTNNDLEEPTVVAHKPTCISTKELQDYLKANESKEKSEEMHQFINTLLSADTTEMYYNFRHHLVLAIPITIDVQEVEYNDEDDSDYDYWEDDYHDDEDYDDE